MAYPGLFEPPWRVLLLSGDNNTRIDACIIREVHCARSNVSFRSQLSLQVPGHALKLFKFISTLFKFYSTIYTHLYLMSFSIHFELLDLILSVFSFVALFCRVGRTCFSFSCSHTISLVYPSFSPYIHIHLHPRSSFSPFMSPILCFCPFG